jgi:hypothetical protein
MRFGTQVDCFSQKTMMNQENGKWDKNEWDKAIEYYEKSLKIKEKLGDVQGIATQSCLP